jgi:hypothetical protein
VTGDGAAPLGDSLGNVYLFILLLIASGCATAPPAPPGPVTAWGYRLESAAVSGFSAVTFSEVKEECEVTFAKDKLDVPKKVPWAFPGDWTGCRQMTVIPGSGNWYAYTFRYLRFGRWLLGGGAASTQHYCEGLRSSLTTYSPTPCGLVTLHYLDGKP